MKQLFSYVAIPCTNFSRAYEFYTHLTGGMIERNPNVPFPMAYFVDKEQKYIGHLFQLPAFKPSADGVIVYLQAEDMEKTLELVEIAGGTIVLPKTLIGPGKGYWSLFLDTEGNKLALHSAE